MRFFTRASVVTLTHGGILLVAMCLPSRLECNLSEGRRYLTFIFRAQPGIPHLLWGPLAFRKGLS